MDLLNTDFGLISEYSGTGASEKADADAMKRLWLARSALRAAAEVDEGVRAQDQFIGQGSADLVQQFLVGLRRTKVLSRRLVLNYSR